MADIFGFMLIYIIVGTMFAVFGGGDLIADEDGYVAAGLIIFWPLFILKYVLLLIGYTFYGIFYGIRHYGHKWFVIPIAIGKMFKRTTMSLFGKYQPSHYRDSEGNIILVNSKTGIEMESGKSVDIHETVSVR